MEYITAEEAAKKWNRTRRSVQIYCANGKIPGAISIGKQWLIPHNASKPADRRRKGEKLMPETENYHFPGLIYSRCFTSVDELSEDERLLLEAQLLNIKGELLESIRLCRKIITEADSPSVKFGAFCTNAVNFQLLGLVDELCRCMMYMENVCDQHPVHEEDYRLLLAFCSFHQTFSAEALYRIDVTKLSPDAIIAFNCLLSNVLIFNPDKPPKTTLMLQEGFLRNLELWGITPAVLVSHSILAVLCARVDDIEGEHRHVEQVCRIGYENGYKRLLTKTSSVAPESFHIYLSKIGSGFAKEIEKKRIENAENWRRAYEYVSGKKLSAIRDCERDIVMLLFYKRSIKDIALIKNVSEDEVRQTIKNLCELNGVSSKKELVKYYNKLFYTPAKEDVGEDN